MFTSTSNGKETIACTTAGLTLNPVTKATDGEKVGDFDVSMTPEFLSEAESVSFALCKRNKPACPGLNTNQLTKEIQKQIVKQLGTTAAVEAGAAITGAEATVLSVFLARNNTNNSTGLRILFHSTSKYLRTNSQSLRNRRLPRSHALQAARR